MDKAWAIFLALLGSIGFFSILAFRNWIEKEAIRRQSNWSSAKGTVTFSESSIKESNPSGVYDGGVSTNYVVTKVRFSYHLGGKQYHGEQEWADSGLSRKEIPKAEKYPSGTKVTIYFNPDNPKEAVIEQTIEASEGLGCLNNLLGAALALSTGLFIIGLIFLIGKC